MRIRNCVIAIGMALALSAPAVLADDEDNASADSNQSMADWVRDMGQNSLGAQGSTESDAQQIEQIPERE